MMNLLALEVRDEQARGVLEHHVINVAACQSQDNNDKLPATATMPWRSRHPILAMPATDQ